MYFFSILLTLKYPIQFLQHVTRVPTAVSILIKLDLFTLLLQDGQF